MSSDGNDILQQASQGEFDYDSSNLYSTIWRNMFHPVSRLQTKINHQLVKQELQNGMYSVAHRRNIYPPIHLEYDVVYQRTLRGLKCASTLYPGSPILVASDHVTSNIVAQNISKTLKDTVRIEVMDSDEDGTSEILHFDHDPLWKSRIPSDYDKVFVDLYLLAESKCVAYGKGGYVKFGMRLSYGQNSKNDKCAINHQTNHPFTPFQWNLVNGTTFGHFGMSRV